MEQVNNIIQKVEQQHAVRVLYACETGSRAWGFPSPDSDFDIRFVYMHQPDWYLSLAAHKDTIEYMEGDWDVTGWDLRKSLLLLKKANAPLIERFQSPIVYFSNPIFQSDFRELITQYYSPTAVFFHHYSLAQKFWQEITDAETFKLKSWFYLVRSLLSCNWIINDKSVLPMHIEGLMMYVSEQDRTMLRELIQLKATVGEKYWHKADKVLQDWAAQLMQFVETHKDNLGICNTGMQPLEAFFLKMLHATGNN